MLFFISYHEQFLRNVCPRGMLYELWQTDGVNLAVEILEVKLNEKK